MLISTIEAFVEVIPTAEGTDFKAIKPFLLDAENQLVGLFLGDDLYTYIESLDASAKLQQTYIRLLCLQAYENAIPFVDLIQTPTGFGVVSNSNTAPASKERVERLLDWVSRQVDIATDLLVQEVVGSSAALAEWTKFSQFDDFTDCLFLTGRDFSQYAKCTELKRRSFLGIKNELISWQTNVIEKVISADYLKQLISEVRLNVFTSGSETVIHYCKVILGLLANGKNTDAEGLCYTLSNILDANLPVYKKYAESGEYALKISQKYVNAKSDPTYFF